MGGRAVHARDGDRLRYRALHSKLCASSEPRRVVDALVRLHAFTTLYIADLDAILGRGDNLRQIESIRRHHPRLTLWLDSGVRDAAALERWASAGLHPVVGSESLADVTLLHHSALKDPQRYAVLSLDFRGDFLLGPAELAGPTLWPVRLIAMSLARVGSNQGPDLKRLRQLIALAPSAAWYAAGGVRDADDLSALADLGLKGALIASALHTGAIDAAILGAYAD